MPDRIWHKDCIFPKKKRILLGFCKKQKPNRVILRRFQKVLALILMMSLWLPILTSAAQAKHVQASKRMLWLRTELNPDGDRAIQCAFDTALARDTDSTDAFLLAFVAALRTQDRPSDALSLDFKRSDEALADQLRAKLFGFSANQPPAQALLQDVTLIKYLVPHRKLDDAATFSHEFRPEARIRSFQETQSQLPAPFPAELASSACPMGP